MHSVNTVKHHLYCADWSRLSPKYLNVSRATAEVMHCKASPSPSSASLHVLRATYFCQSGPALIKPYPCCQPRHSLARLQHQYRRYWTQSVPCPLSADSHRLPPTFLVCTPRPATGSVPALAAPSLSVSCAGSLRPGPAYCTGPLIWCFEASNALPLQACPCLALASASSPLHSSIGLQALRATNLLRWKAARKCQSLWLAGSVGALQTTNRQSRHPTVLRAGSRAVTSAIHQDPALVHRP